MQAAALGDDHGHDEPPNGRAGRERMTEALDAVVAADDQAGAERAAALEFGRDARLQVEVALAGSPGAQRRLERACRVDCERREALLLGGLEGEAQAGERVSGVDAEARMPITRQRRRRAAGELARGCHQPCVALEPLDRLQREAATREIVLGGDTRSLDVRGQSERVAGRDDDPHRARGRARLDAILESGGKPCDCARCRQDDRGCAKIGEQRTHLRELRSDLCVGRAFGSSERRDDDGERCHVHRPLSTRRCSAEQNAIW